MRFVTVSHPQLGTTRVPEVRVPHLAEGWTVIDDTDEQPLPPAAVDGDESSSSSSTEPDPQTEHEPAHRAHHRHGHHEEKES